MIVMDAIDRMAGWDDVLRVVNRKSSQVSKCVPKCPRRENAHERREAVLSQ